MKYSRETPDNAKSVRGGSLIGCREHNWFLVSTFAGGGAEDAHLLGFARVGVSYVGSRVADRRVEF